MTIGNIILLIIGAIFLIRTLILYIRYKERGDSFTDSAPGLPWYMITHIFGWVFIILGFIA